jgi:hypothetical protein
MSGFGNPARQTLPYRDVVVTAFKYLERCIEPPFAYERQHFDLGRGEGARTENLVHIPDVGWQLKSYQFDPSNVHEYELGINGIQTIGNSTLIAAPGVEDKQVNRPPQGTGMNASLAYWVSVAQTKSVAATASWEAGLPGPAIGANSASLIPLDWVARTPWNHVPIEPISFEFSVPASAIDIIGPLVEIAFSGPAGSSDRHRGIGQYQLQLGGDGMGFLQEWGYAPGSHVLELKFREAFKWAANLNTVSGSTHYFTIFSDAFDDGTGSYPGTKIVILSNVAGASSKRGTSSSLMVTLGEQRQSANFESWTYKVPRKTDEPCTPNVVRMAVRRDVRAVFRIVRHTYPESGFLEDAGFALDFVPTDRKPFNIEWYGNFPAGTSINLRLFNAEDNSEIAGVTTISDQFGGSKRFNIPAGVRQYWCRFDFARTGSLTPTLKSMRVFRDGVYERPDIDPIVIRERRDGGTFVEAAVQNLAIQAASHESNDEAAAFDVVDLAGQYPLIHDAAEAPILIETKYDALGTKTPLFYGYSQLPDVQIREARRGLDGNLVDYPAEDWRHSRMTLVGYWKHLEETYSPQRFTWFDRVADLPMKVTDVIRYLLIAGKVPPAQIDIPDLPVRLSGFDEDELITEPGAKIIDIAAALAKNYFGAYFIRDHWAGTEGMVRFVQPHGLPLYTLAKLYTGHPGDGLAPHASGAFGTTLSGDQEIPHTYIRAGTFHVTSEKPEGNCVVVYGGGNASARQGDTTGVQLTQVLMNVKSYNFLGLATDHPNYPRAYEGDEINIDFLGDYKPIKYYDASLMEQSVVDRIARLVYLASCFGRRAYSFEAPLILVTDVRDELQTKPRPLRTGDAVQIRWQKESGEEVINGIVRRNDPIVDKNGNQWGRMEVVTSSVIDQLGFFNWNDEYLRRARRLISKFTGLVSQQHTQSQKGSGPGAAAWMALPHPTAARIQDLNPDSPTFGDLTWSLDFSPLG